MIIPSTTLFGYISKSFLKNLLAMIFILLGIIIVFDVVDIIKQTSGNNTLPFDLILTISLMKAPNLGEQILPLGILFAAIYTCWKLNKTSEIAVMRSAGISAWQFLMPIVVCGFFVGVVSTTIINPISSIFLHKHDQMERIHIDGDINLATISKTGIWLRQPTNDGYALMNANSLNSTTWEMSDVIILFFNNEDQFIKRFDSDTATLRDRHWEISSPLINAKSESLRAEESVMLPTSLTSQKIEESFSDPETIPFWGLSDYIDVMEQTGFPSTRTYMHFHKLLSRPLMFIALILLAASFSLRPVRFNSTAYMIACGLGIGFAIFLMESFMTAFGMSQKIPVYLAAWSPAIIAMLIGITSLLHLEDG